MERKRLYHGDSCKRKKKYPIQEVAKKQAKLMGHKRIPSRIIALARVEDIILFSLRRSVRKDIDNDPAIRMIRKNPSLACP
jgi:hypothetical protein